MLVFACLGVALTLKNVARCVFGPLEMIELLSCANKKGWCMVLYWVLFVAMLMLVACGAEMEPPTAPKVVAVKQDDLFAAFSDASDSEEVEEHTEDVCPLPTGPSWRFDDHVSEADRAILLGRWRRCRLIFRCSMERVLMTSQC